MVHTSTWGAVGTRGIIIVPEPITNKVGVGIVDNGVYEGGASTGAYNE